jgi:hypothetical protein
MVNCNGHDDHWWLLQFTSMSFSPFVSVKSVFVAVFPRPPIQRDELYHRANHGPSRDH